MTTPSSVFFKSHWAFGDKSKLDDKALTGDFKYRPSSARGANLVLSFGGLRYSENKIDSTYGRYLADYSAKGELPASAQGTTDHGDLRRLDPAGLLPGRRDRPEEVRHRLLRLRPLRQLGRGGHALPDRRLGPEPRGHRQRPRRERDLPGLRADEEPGELDPGPVSVDQVRLLQATRSSPSKSRTRRPRAM
jgi:hypothetical protein